MIALRIIHCTTLRPKNHHSTSSPFQAGVNLILSQSTKTPDGDMVEIEKTWCTPDRQMFVATESDGQVVGCAAVKIRSDVIKPAAKECTGVHLLCPCLLLSGRERS